LYTILAILRLRLLFKVDLEIGRIIVVLIFLAIDIVLYIIEHYLCFKTGLVCKYNVEIELLISICALWLRDIVIEFGNDLQSGLLVV